MSSLKNEPMPASSGQGIVAADLAAAEGWEEVGDEPEQVHEMEDDETEEPLEEEAKEEKPKSDPVPPKKKRWSSYDEQVREARRALNAQSGQQSIATSTAAETSVPPEEKREPLVPDTMSHLTEDDKPAQVPATVTCSNDNKIEVMSHEVKSVGTSVVREEEEDDVVVGAAAVGGVLGWLVIGPAVGSYSGWRRCWMS